MAEYLMDDVSFPVCSPHLAGGRLPTRPADLAHHTLLRSEREFWQPWFAAAGLDWPEPTRGPMFNDASPHHACMARAVNQSEEPAAGIPHGGVCEERGGNALAYSELIPMSEGHLRSILKYWVEHYNRGATNER